MFGKAGLAGLMKQAQQMQDKMKQAQADLVNLEVNGEAGAGMVKVLMNGHYGVKRVTIEPSLLGADEDKEMLEDLIAAAVNDAVKKVEAATQEKMGQFTQGLNMPPGMGDFFK